MIDQGRQWRAAPENRRGDPSTWQPIYRHRMVRQVIGAMTLSPLCGGVAAAQGASPAQLRRFIDRQVGGIQKLMVPAREQRTYRTTNNGTSPVDTHLLVVATGLSFQVEMTNASGFTSTKDPYRRVFLPNGVLAPGQSIDVALRFKRHGQSPRVSFSLTLLSGQGNP
jgi:hypothetical protein